MEDFKEFKGKDIDAAIAEACAYFNAAREKLEIEIVQDAKSGIFGIVGARKAKVRARRMQLREAVENILGRRMGEADLALSLVDRDEALPSSGPAEKAQPARSGAACAAHAQGPGERTPESDSAARANGNAAGEPARADVSPAPAPGEKKRSRRTRSCGETAAAEGAGALPQESPAAAEPGSQATPDAVDPMDDDLEELGEGLPATPLEQLDAGHLEALADTAVRQLVRPIVGENVRLAIRMGNGRVHVGIDCEEDSGLLIGREGQTLASLQYMVSRIVSRGMGAAVRVQLDVGEYRRRQDDKLREMALALAEKVRQTGRSYSTRPLSSYHRRIVHICLQDVQDVQTRSTGEGAMKRVVIMRRRSEHIPA